jgi:hypothetical protein
MMLPSEYSQKMDAWLEQSVSIGQSRGGLCLATGPDMWDWWRLAIGGECG